MRQTIAFLDKSIRHQTEMDIYIAKFQEFTKQTWTIIPPINARWIKLGNLRG